MPNRRTLLKTVAGASLMSAASLGRVLGANDRVRVGLIGHGLIGTRHLLDFKAQPDVEIVGVAELSDARLEAAAAAAGNGPARYKDFRKLLDRQDVDAVVVSTPDHWHALMTILACAAGKDVYVEKPLTHVVREGEWMQQAAAAHKRVVQVGTQQRSGRHYAALRGARARRTHRRGPQRAHVGVPQHPARLLEGGRRAARGGGLGHVARARALRPLRPGALPLPLPLVLGLLGRPDHEPPGPPHRHRAVDDGQGPAARLGDGRSLRAQGHRRDARRLRGDLRVPRLPRDLVEPRAGRGRRGRARLLRHHAERSRSAAPGSRSFPSARSRPRTRSRASAGRGPCRRSPRSGRHP